MAKESIQQDRNFDDLAQRFQKNIYGGLKGEIRLAVLERDCNAHLNRDINPGCKPLRILDAGGGQGQFSLSWAQAGHELVICDISREMLKLAEIQIKELKLEHKVTLIQSSIQGLQTAKLAASSTCKNEFDFIICHAVMEWLQNPEELLPCLLNFMAPQAVLSLTFYNLNSLIYKNLLRTNFKKILEKDFSGSRGSLTPINPQDPQQVLAQVRGLPLELLCHSGIRVFHDYIFNDEHRAREPENLLKLELELSQREPYRSLGRYIHLLLRKNASNLQINS